MLAVPESSYKMKRLTGQKLSLQRVPVADRARLSPHVMRYQFPIKPWAKNKPAIIWQEPSTAFSYSPCVAPDVGSRPRRRPTSFPGQDVKDPGNYYVLYGVILLRRQLSVPVRRCHQDVMSTKGRLRPRLAGGTRGVFPSNVCVTILKEWGC